MFRYTNASQWSLQPPKTIPHGGIEMEENLIVPCFLFFLSFYLFISPQPEQGIVPHWICTLRQDLWSLWAKVERSRLLQRDDPSVYSLSLKSWLCGELSQSCIIHISDFASMVFIAMFIGVSTNTFWALCFHFWINDEENGIGSYRIYLLV